MMNDVKRIVITSTSGYGSVADAYQDRLTLTLEGISYKRTPEIESDYNYGRTWTFKTNNREYQGYVDYLAEKVVELIRNGIPYEVTDVGVIGFTVVYEDGTRLKDSYKINSSYFSNILSGLEEYLPRCETLPILSYDDEEDDEDDDEEDDELGV